MILTPPPEWRTSIQIWDQNPTPTPKSVDRRSVYPFLENKKKRSKVENATENTAHNGAHKCTELGLVGHRKGGKNMPLKMRRERLHIFGGL